jgi:hypothetical protein
MSYRDGSFTSPVDGTVSIVPKIPWVERKADFDSKEAFLALCIIYYSSSCWDDETKQK